MIDLQIFFCKEPDIKTFLGFLGHIVSVTTTQFHYCTQTTTENTQIDGCGAALFQ